MISCIKKSPKGQKGETMRSYTENEVLTAFQDVVTESYNPEKVVARVFETKNTTTITKEEKDRLVDKMIAEFKMEVEKLWQK